MKKAFLLLLLICSSISVAFAQQQTPTATVSINQNTEYVSVSVRSFLIRKNYSAYLNYGDGDSRSGNILDASGEKREFTNSMGVLKYLSQQGWQFVAYIPDDEGKISEDRFLMKRDMAQ